MKFFIIFHLVIAISGGFTALYKNDYFSRGLSICLFTNLFGLIALIISPKSKAKEEEKPDDYYWPQNSAYAVLATFLAAMIYIGSNYISKNYIKESSQPITHRKAITYKDTSNNITLTLNYDEKIPVGQKIAQSTAQFIEVLSDSNEDAVKQILKENNSLIDKILNYMKFNNPNLMHETINAQIHKTQIGYEVREIAMSHWYPTLHKQTEEFLVLDFTEDGQLIDINLSITEDLLKYFHEQASDSSKLERRHKIIKFIERYRMFYLTRDIRIVDSIFAEDALIIVGQKMSQMKLPDNYEYINLNKREYLERQKKVFDLQKDIFLDFSSIDIITKNDTLGLYGVELQQSYFSTNYSDEGYLFLLIKFKAHDSIIPVRAWQSNKWDNETLLRKTDLKF